MHDKDCMHVGAKVKSSIIKLGFMLFVQRRYPVLVLSLITHVKYSIVKYSIDSSCCLQSCTYLQERQEKTHSNQSLLLPM